MLKKERRNYVGCLNIQLWNLFSNGKHILDLWHASGLYKFLSHPFSFTATKPIQWGLGTFSNLRISFIIVYATSFMFAGYCSSLQSVYGSKYPCETFSQACSCSVSTAGWLHPRIHRSSPLTLQDWRKRRSGQLKTCPCIEFGVRIESGW